MKLPFSEAEFLEVFGRYNTGYWPVVLLLWLASALALVLVWRGRPFHRFTTFLIAVQWVWAGVAYHVLLFSRINPVAMAFGLGFMVEAVLVLWAGWSDEGVRYTAQGWRRGIGLGLAGYGLVYPFLAMAFVHPYPNTPTFGVPCPTTLFTAGLLLLAAPRRRLLLVVPLLWSVIGSSAAIVLGVETDFALLVVVLTLLIALTAPRLLDGRRDSEAKVA